MPIPGYQDFMLPLLQFAADGQERRIPDAMDALAKQMGVTEQEREIMLPSGTQSKLYNRVSWAITYLVKSLLLEKSGRGKFRISAKGLDTLKKNPARIDARYLAQFAEFNTFVGKSNNTDDDDSATTPAATDLEEADDTPEERIGEAYEKLRATLADDLLRKIRTGSPKAFEHLVMKVLQAIGYGKGHVERARVTGKSGDDGIDCMIPQDRLELDMVYVQAKRHEGAVGPGDIDKFVGSLLRKKASKGVFITSGTFTTGAQRASREAAVKLRLIDGDELADLMIDANVGVETAYTYVVKKMNVDFFDDLPT